MGVSYNRNVGIAMDTDLVLLVVDADVLKCEIAQTRVLSEIQGFSDPCLKWNAKLPRLSLDLERGVTQTRVGRDAKLSDSRQMRAYSGLHLKSPCFLGCEVRISV